MDINATLEMAGSVEQLLMRLIQERVSLTSGEKLVADYRAIVSDFANAQSQLELTKKELQKTESDLNTAQAGKASQIEEIERELNGYRNRRVSELQVDINLFQEQRTVLVTELSNLQRQSDDLRAEHARRVREYNEQITALQATIEELKRQRQSISDSIIAAGQMLDTTAQT